MNLQAQRQGMSIPIHQILSTIWIFLVCYCTNLCVHVYESTDENLYFISFTGNPCFLRITNTGKVMVVFVWFNLEITELVSFKYKFNDMCIIFLFIIKIFHLKIVVRTLILFYSSPSVPDLKYVFLPNSCTET